MPIPGPFIADDPFCAEDAQDICDTLTTHDADISALQGLLNRVRNAALTTPASLQDGDLWVEASGSVPNRVITLYLRDGGVSVPLFTVTRQS